MGRIRSKTSTRRSTARKRKPQTSSRRRCRRVRRRRHGQAGARPRPAWKPLTESGSRHALVGRETAFGVMRAAPRRFRRARRTPTKTKEFGRTTFEMRLSVHITVQPPSATEPRRGPLAWCNERAGVATVLTLVATILMLGLMVWQQSGGPPPRLDCPPGAKVCNVHITNNFYGPVQIQAGSGGEPVLARPLPDGPFRASPRLVVRRANHVRCLSHLRPRVGSSCLAVEPAVAPAHRSSDAPASNDSGRS